MICFSKRKPHNDHRFHRVNARGWIFPHAGDEFMNLAAWRHNGTGACHRQAFGLTPSVTAGEIAEKTDRSGVG